MNTHKLWRVVLVLAAGAALFGQTPAGPKPKETAGEETRLPPLVRLDLLEKPPAQLGPPKRNIFSPRASGAGLPLVNLGAPRPTAIGSAVSPPANIGGALGATAAEGTVPSNQAPAFTIDLRYVGFVESEKTGRIIGLVVFQGQARAVVEGEVISEGISIGRITRKEIAVNMPDSSTKTFSLEGEDR